ncbi:MAG: cytochrome P450 [Acidimicrobiia bacterium]|nr:cytochrome P450 [Acidimicrobiia bacterium]
MQRQGIPEIEEALGAPDFQDRMHEVFAELRERAPVYWSPSLNYWLVTRFDLVEEVLRNPADYSSQGAEEAYIRRLPTEVTESLQILPHHFRHPGLIHSDGAKHTALRRIVNPSFTPAALAPLAADIRREVVALLEPARLAGEPFDVVKTLAKPLPVKVIAGLLGVGADALDRFPGWSVQLARFFTGPLPRPDIARDLDGALVEWREFVCDLLDRRAAEPRDDFISVVAGAIGNGRMTRGDGIAIVVHALQAGHETSTNLIATSIHLLLAHPQQRELARSSPQWLEYAFEEVLRFEAPAVNGRRRATRPLSLGGRPIEAGDTVVVNIAAAHRDPAQYPDPGRFDITRRLTKADHMGFGRGPHFCLGASLARLEVPIAVDEFLARFPRATLVSGTPAWKAPRDQRGLAELWVEPGSTSAEPERLAALAELGA